VAFSAVDRLIFVGLYRLVPNAIKALAIVKPDTVIRWHRAGFRSYWRWKSRNRCGRPTVLLEIRRLIREMSIANPLWGTPRIHGELLKLGIEIGQTSVAKYMCGGGALPRRDFSQRRRIVKRLLNQDVSGRSPSFLSGRCPVCAASDTTRQDSTPEAFKARTNFRCPRRRALRYPRTPPSGASGRQRFA
jgi:hypothetical protein